MYGFFILEAYVFTDKETCDAASREGKKQEKCAFRVSILVIIEMNKKPKWSSTWKGFVVESGDDISIFNTGYRAGIRLTVTTKKS